MKKYKTAMNVEQRERLIIEILSTSSSPLNKKSLMKEMTDRNKDISVTSTPEFDSFQKAVQRSLKALLDRGLIETKNSIRPLLYTTVSGIPNRNEIRREHFEKQVRTLKADCEQLIELKKAFERSEVLHDEFENDEELLKDFTDEYENTKSQLNAKIADLHVCEIMLSKLMERQK